MAFANGQLERQEPFSDPAFFFHPFSIPFQFFREVFSVPAAGIKFAHCGSALKRYRSFKLIPMGVGGS
jgi:hypothetical protein